MTRPMIATLAALALVVLAVFTGPGTSARAEVSLFAPSPLLVAVGNGDTNQAKVLLVRGASPDQTDMRGVTVLIHAINANNLDMVDLLLQHGAHINLADKGGNPPLYWAAETGDVLMVQKLLSQGAKIDQENRQAMTPLMNAARNGHAEVVDVLLKAGAKRSLTDYTGRDALAWAQESRNPRAAALLRQGGGR